MHVGEPVEVFSTFEQIWTDGFEIAAVGDGGYGLRRLSDGALLPGPTRPDDLRPIPAAHPPRLGRR